MTLSRAVAAFLSTQILATIWAVAYQLPYQFGGHGAPDRVLQDFWSHGTALSAPAPVLIVVGIVSLLSLRRSRVGTVATAILILLMALAVLTGVLEPTVRQALTGGLPPLERAGILVLTVAGLTLAVLVMVVAGGQLRARFARSSGGVGAA